MASSARRYNPYLLAGNRVTGALRRPGAAEDGKVTSWDNAAKRFTMADGGGGEIVGAIVLIGDWDASVNAFPPDADIKKGHAYRFSDGGYPDGDPVDGIFCPAGTLAIAMVDNPGQVLNNWRLI